MSTRQQIEEADRRVGILNRAVDQAREAGNGQAAEEFSESLHQARMARIQLGNDED